MEDTFLNLQREYPVVLVTGARQVGKTTMLERMLGEEQGNRTRVSLDDLNTRQLAKNDPAMFFQINAPPIYIDEVQYAPELFPYIKLHVDKHHRPGDFWLTGSQLFKLMDGVQESLAGRVALLHMPPLTQSEINRNADPTPFRIDTDILADRQNTIGSKSITDMYQQIFTGGMPALVSGQYSNRDAFYSSYLSTYLERDVKEQSGTIDSLKFMNFITATASITGNLLNYKVIAENSDIDQKTAKSWLRILESLGIIFYLHPYAGNTLKRLVKTPKLYFFDTGLVAYLTKWSNAETLQNGALSGSILENFVISEIAKGYMNIALEPFIYYYRDKDSKEIDVIMERDGVIHPIEIKKTSIPGSQLTGVFKLLDKPNLPKRGAGAVICMVDKLGALDRNNLLIPVWLI